MKLKEVDLDTVEKRSEYVARLNEYAIRDAIEYNNQLRREAYGNFFGVKI